MIVGDQTLPKTFNIHTTAKNSDNLVFLNANAQKSMNSEFVDNLPWRSFGRKNVGSLYAIDQGAEVIWDFDDDNMLKFWLEGASPVPGLDITTYLPNGKTDGNNNY